MPQNSKWLSEEALQIAEKRREAKGKGEKERYPFEWRFLKKLKIELERLEISSRKLEISREHIMQRWA